MITLIKGCKIYAPDCLGRKDLLIGGGKIEGICDNIDHKNLSIDIEVIDGSNKILFPGFIDCHVHVIGGGGEGGFSTRTPEITLSTLTTAGITSVIGCLGTDNVCRNINTLISKVKSLKEEGISAYAYTGSYEIPVRTITGSIKGDIMLIDEIIGVGEIAISDHRSSQPNLDDFIKVVAESRVGGILSNKCGIVDIHLGDGVRKINYIFELLDNTEIPAKQMLPTHINRNSELFKDGINYAKKGGFIDLTTSCDLEHMQNGELRASEGLEKYINENLPIEHITFSSDGNGSMPRFDESGKVDGIGICSVKSLYDEVKFAILDKKIPIEKAIRVITSNTADLFKLRDKGRVEINKDADLVMVDEKTLKIDKVFAKGRMMVDSGSAIVKGIFE